MSLDENISHCFREYPKMKRRIEILETENQRLQAEVARLRKALEECAEPRSCSQACDCETIARAALEVKHAE